MLFSIANADAAIFRCVDANSAVTYSDRACDAPASHADQRADAVETTARRLEGAREKRASRILELLRIAPAEPETLVLQRTVDDAAPDLVKSLDPDNTAWTPANAKWHSVSEFVKADLRRDVQSALRQSTAQVSITTAREYATRAIDTDMDALLAFLQTADGTSYVAFQNEIRPLLYSALSSLQAQEPVPDEPPSSVLMNQRKQLLVLSMEYRIAKEGGRTTRDLQPGSATVADNAALREGNTLDALYTEYEVYLPRFQAFSDSATAKRFFAALEPALRTEFALSSTATTDFAEQEFGRYFGRWRSVYGPAMRMTTRTTFMIRGRSVSITHTTQGTTIPYGSAEAMAIQCEQRESNQQPYRNVRDGNAQAADFRAIQNRCRAEQRLPPL